MRTIILPLSLLLCTHLPSLAGWEEDVRERFSVFAKAMGEGKYSPMFEMLTAASSNQYRLVMLNYFEAAEKRGQPESPPDDDGKPMVLAKLKGLSNAQPSHSGAQRRPGGWFYRGGDWFWPGRRLRISRC